MLIVVCDSGLMDVDFRAVFLVLVLPAVASRSHAPTENLCGITSIWAGSRMLRVFDPLAERPLICGQKVVLLFMLLNFRVRPLRCVLRLLIHLASQMLLN
jgi:hypothetical protein